MSGEIFRISEVLNIELKFKSFKSDTTIYCQTYMYCSEIFNLIRIFVAETIPSMYNQIMHTQRYNLLTYFGSIVIGK